MATNPLEFRPVTISQHQGLTWSDDLGEVARQAARLFAKGEDNRSKLEAEVLAAANEKRLYQVLLNGPHGEAGWRTHWPPMHRIAEITPDAAEIIRRKAVEYPLTVRVLTYGEDKQIEWFQSRNPWQLTDEELYSDPKYVALYDAAATRGECSPRVQQTAPAGTEPTPDDRMQWVKNIEAARTALQQQPGTYPLRDQLGTLITGLRNFSLPVFEAIDLAFTGQRQEDGIETGRRVAMFAEVVPELGRLVEWLNERQKAA